MDLLTLFFWSFLAATIVPLGSEPALAVIASRRDALLVPVLVATAGNYLGACTTYLLARAAIERVDEKKHRRMQRAADIVRRYGSPALLLSWVPLIGDAIVAAAGAAKVRFVPFSIWTIIGKAARYVVVAMAAQAAMQ